MRLDYFNSGSYFNLFKYILLISPYLPGGFSDFEMYDVIVIGGGSAGLAFAKEAAEHNMSVVVLDYGMSSTRGTTWGIGGTCVNAGCIPKKLFHQAALLKDGIKDSNFYGWDSEVKKLNWHKLVENVGDYIKSIRWKLRRELNQKNITFMKALASFLDRNTVNARTLMNNPEIDGHEIFKNITIRGETIVIAIGCRSSIPKSPKELKNYCITSDDLFYLEEPPGKTLVIGAGYIGLEVAGFLNGLGFPVTVAVRNRLLKDFDSQMVNLIEDYMTEGGIKFLMHCDVVSVQEINSSDVMNLHKKAYLVIFVDRIKKDRFEDVFDTVFCATGRKPATDILNLDVANVIYDIETGKIPTIEERTNIPHIYAIGDVSLGKPELTPVAMKAAHLLAKRIFGNGTQKMDYRLVPTVVYTPLEYGRIGWNEADALEHFGDDNIEVYHSYYYPLEWEIPRADFGGDSSKCYIKIISHKKSDKVIGIHITGPHAGDIIQGFAVAMKSRLTMAKLQNTLGIHPTIAEELTRMSITKSSGLNPRQLPCCS